MDSVKLELARERVTKEEIRNIEFRQANVLEWDEDSVYDLIYVRVLLTHLPERERVVPKLLRALRPGGALAVEDVNFEGTFRIRRTPPTIATSPYIGKSCGFAVAMLISARNSLRRGCKASDLTLCTRNTRKAPGKKSAFLI